MPILVLMDRSALEKLLAPFNEQGCEVNVYLTHRGASGTPALLRVALIVIERVTVRDPGQTSWHVQLREIGYDTADRGIHSWRADQYYHEGDSVLWMRDTATNNEMEFSRTLDPEIWRKWIEYRDGVGRASVRATDIRLAEWAASSASSEAAP